MTQNNEAQEARRELNNRKTFQLRETTNRHECEPNKRFSAECEIQSCLVINQVCIPVPFVRTWNFIVIVVIARLCCSRRPLSQLRTFLIFMLYGIE